MRGRGRPPLLTGARRYPNRLRELREHRGLSQQAVARAAGISGAYYGALERGDKRVNTDTAEKLAQALDCAAGDLLSGARRASAPLVFAVAAAEAETRPPEYDLPEPHERVLLPRPVDAENCVAAEIFDDSADIDFTPGTVLLLRRATSSPLSVAVGAKVVARFFLDAPEGRDADRRTHEILYGIFDRNIVGDLVLITRSSNRLIPRNLLIQGAPPGRPGFAERGVMAMPHTEPVAYERRPDDPAELLGVVIYAMGPI
ncbi:MAG TPA: helix-turn-helix transcriptional regulator [Stellaceae bacterium]|nr:helix-turn-helix transcriptional regulator [Stellaceae bacterium]